MFVCLFVRSFVCCLLKQKPCYTFSDVIVNKVTMGSERNDCLNSKLPSCDVLILNFAILLIRISQFSLMWTPRC